MRIARFQIGSTVSFGVIEGDTVTAIEAAPWQSTRATGESYPLADVKLLAPVEPPDVFAIGLNYKSHADEFEAEYPDRREKITSTMIDFGIPHGYTSMARTVGLPSAIGVRLVLEGKVQLTGVQAPVMPEIYEPVLDELESLGIRFVETWETLPPA